MHTHAYVLGSKAKPWPKIGAPAAARPAPPAASTLHEVRSAGRAAAGPPILGQGFAFGPNMYAYVCICIHIYMCQVPGFTGPPLWGLKFGVDDWPAGWLAGWLAG